MSIPGGEPSVTQSDSISTEQQVKLDDPWRPLPDWITLWSGECMYVCIDEYSAKHNHPQKSLWIDLSLAKVFNKLKLLLPGSISSMISSVLYLRLKQVNVYLYSKHLFDFLQLSEQKMMVFPVYPLGLFCFTHHIW